MDPRFPLFIPSKSRYDSRLTAKALLAMGLPFRVVVEEQEFGRYEAVLGREHLLVLDPEYQRKYDPCDDLGDSRGKGPGPARNFIWDLAVSEGHAWHWVMDDNIRSFWRLNRNRKIPVADGTIFSCMEDFCLRYTNVAMAGPQYYMFAPRKSSLPPFVLNTRIYSCNLIRCDAPYRWRGRYNEDTDLSLRMLKDGWCTVQFNAFLQYKMPTQRVKGGNTDEFYRREGKVVEGQQYAVNGTLAKSQMQVKLHPDVSRLTWRFGRVHHYVDYHPFRQNKLKRKLDVAVADGVDDYGMKLIDVDKWGRPCQPQTP